MFKNIKAYFLIITLPDCYVGYVLEGNYFEFWILLLRIP